MIQKARATVLADYEGQPIDAKRAIWAIGQAEIFVLAIEAKFFA